MSSEPATGHSPLATHSDNEVLVRVEGVSKKFCRSLKKSLWYGLCDIGAELNPFRRQVAEVASSGLLVAGDECAEGGSSSLATRDQLPVTGEAGLRPGEFWAVNDVSFELRRGECLGLIGHNGAGKTTLLKMLNGLIKPDAGRITMRGRVGALIALGAGFNPILTGRENIYINGSVLGLSKKEIEAKIDEIIDFAEIGEFIDTPVQNYSSGMQVRLGFAVATALDPDVLILDEVLAVGDAAFRAKCYDRIGRLQSNSAVIFVSHSLDQIAQVCTRICGMQKGRGQLFESKEDGIRWLADQTAGAPQDAERVEFLNDLVASFSAGLSGSGEVVHGGTISLCLTLAAREELSAVSIRVVFYSADGSIVAEWNSANAGFSRRLSRGANKLEIKLGPMHLKQGVYAMGILLQNEKSRETLVWSHKKHDVSVRGPVLGSPCYVLP